MSGRTRWLQFDATSVLGPHLYLLGVLRAAVSDPPGTFAGHSRGGIWGWGWLVWRQTQTAKTEGQTQQTGQTALQTKLQTWHQTKITEWEGSRARGASCPLEKHCFVSFPSPDTSDFCPGRDQETQSMSASDACLLSLWSKSDDTQTFFQGGTSESQDMSVSP